jgi:hypothetical protein
MTRFVALAVVVMFAALGMGCSRSLVGTTWEGNCEQFHLRVQFVGKETVKFTYDADVQTFSYSADGNLVKFSFGGRIGTATIEGGQLVGTAQDFRVNSDPTQCVLARK